MSVRLTDAQGLATAIDRLAGWLRREVPSELSMSSMSALDRLHHEGPLRVSELAERESMTQPGVTLLVNRLSGAGHAERVPDPTDRRAALVRITASGSALLAERRALRAQILRERIAGLDDEEQRLLAQALPAIDKLVGGGRRPPRRHRDDDDNTGTTMTTRTSRPVATKPDASAHGGGSGPTVSPFSQPKAVWAVAFACVISFMGIGLVDPILPALSSKLDASPSQVELLFTSYLVVTAVAMLVTGWVSSRIGAKRTLVVGLTLIVVFAALAGSADSIDGIIGFRAGWGLGNALFIATSLAVIVSSASGGFAGAIVLYESALGVGIALGPLLGGELGAISRRGPFFGVAALMAISLVATMILLPKTPVPERKESITEPIKALRHRALATTSGVGLLYNWGFFTLLGYSPFLMGDISPQQLGLVFCGWGLLVAAFAVWGAPWLKSRFGTPRTLYANFALMTVDLVVIALWWDSPATVIVAVIVAGAFIGVNNTLVTTAVMSIAPVEKPVASATYGFVRFIGGGLAPFVASKLVGSDGDATLPFLLGAGAVVLAAVLLTTVHSALTDADAAAIAAPEPVRLDKVDGTEQLGVGAGIGNET